MEVFMHHGWYRWLNLQFFIHKQKKGKSSKVKDLEANPVFWVFPSNSIKSGSGEYLFHLQGNMCQIEFPIVQNGSY